jgi:AcrR family transcriptional regulator
MNPHPPEAAADTTAKKPDPARRSPRSRRAILDASLQLVGEVGYARLTIEAIAARAGVGKQTIYRWWPSKAAVLLDAFTDPPGATGGDQRLPDTGDVAADLKTVLRATADEFSDPAFEAPYRALAVAGAQDAELGREFRERFSDSGVRVYADRLRAAQATGELAAGLDPALAAELLLGAFAQRWLSRSGPLDHAFTDGLVDLLLHGLRPRE